MIGLPRGRAAGSAGRRAVRAADYGTAAGAWRRLAALAALAGAALATPPASASADLAAKSNCMGCHHATQRRAGPPFQAIARRHAAALQDAQLRAATVEMLARKIRQGGRGAWGVVPMPANPQVSEADARALATWVLEAHR